MKKAGWVLTGCLLAVGFSSWGATPSPQLVEMLKGTPEQVSAARATMRSSMDVGMADAPFVGPGGQDYRDGKLACHIQDLKLGRSLLGSDAVVALTTPLPPSAPSIASVKIPVLLVDFPDEVTPYAAADLDGRLFGSAYSPNMTEYYDEVSYGQLDLTGDVYGPFTMEKTYAEYGWGEDEARQLVADAIQAADPTVDFSQYDSDGDGYVDAVVVASAEYVSAWGWETAHMWSLSTPLAVDGVIAKDYTSQDDDANVGLFCHEFGHVLGLPDFYDQEEVFEYCLMGTGCYLDPPAHPNPWNKVYLGWVEPTEITGSVTAQAIPNVEENPEILLLRPANLPSKEYFLVENRQQIGSDAALPNSGLMIWHVGGMYSVAAVLDLEEAGRGALDRSAEAIPFPGTTGNTEFTPDSIPASDLLNPVHDDASMIYIENISASAGTMTADITVPSRLYGWRGLDSGTEETLNDVWFVDSATGWVVGDNGTILHTADNGDTWTAQSSGVTADLLAVTFVDETNGWACGENGTLLRTTDGVTWRRLSGGTTDALVDLSFANRYCGWVIGEGGTLLRTLTGGRFWQDISPDFLGDVPVRIQFVSSSSGFIGCEDGFLFYTTDRGNTWGYVDMGWPGIDAMHAFGDNYLCWGNSLYFTVDFEGVEAYASVQSSGNPDIKDMDFDGTYGMLLCGGVTATVDLGEEFFWPETDSNGRMDPLEEQTWADVCDMFLVLDSTMNAVSMGESASPLISAPAYAVGTGGAILKHTEILGVITNLPGLGGGSILVESVPEVIETVSMDDLIPVVDTAQYYQYELNLQVP